MSADPPKKLFGRVELGRSGTTPAQSPTSSQFSGPVKHHKPRMVNQPSRDEENSDSEQIEIEEQLPSDPREATPSPTQQYNYSPVPRSQSTPAARVIVTPKKHRITLDTVVEDRVSNENKDKQHDEDMEQDEEYVNIEQDEEQEELDEDVDMEQEDYDEDEEEDDEDEAEEEDEIKEDPATLVPDDYYTNPSRARQGKGTLGKRAKGKSYGGGGKAPRGVGGKSPRGVGAKTPRGVGGTPPARGVGGKSPRVPNGAGKSPAFSARERHEQQQRVKFLTETPKNNTNQTAKKKRNKKKMKTTLGNMPVGNRPRPIRKQRWQEEVVKYQKSTDFMIPKKRFQNLVREITISDLMLSEFLWARTALEALQQVAEDWVTEHLDLTNLAALHGRRVTIFAKDSQLVRIIRSRIAKLEHFQYSQLPKKEANEKSTPKEGSK